MTSFLQSAQRAVAEFQTATGQPVNRSPVVMTYDRECLRARLIGEECREAIQALGNFRQGDNTQALAELAGELVDVIYVALGTAVEYGLELEPFFREIQAANMAKVADGCKRRADGKILKPEGWQPADLRAVLEAQL